MTSLTARMVMNFAATGRDGIALAPVDEQALAEFYFGDGAGEATSLFHYSGGLSASGSVTFRFDNNSTQDPFGRDIEWKSIVALYIRNTGGSSMGGIEAGGNLTTLGGGTIQIPAAGGALMLVAPTAAGWVIDDSSGTLTLTNVSATLPASYTVAALGRKVE